MGVPPVRHAPARLGPIGQLSLLAEVCSFSQDREKGRAQALCRSLAERTMTVQQDSELEQEWLRQNNIIYGALIAVGVFMAQPFLTATSLDLTATICVVVFAVAIPLLAALMLINRQEAFRHRRASQTSSPQRRWLPSVRLHWSGRRLLAHPVDRGSRRIGKWADWCTSPLGRVLAPGTRSAAWALGASRNRDSGQPMMVLPITPNAASSPKHVSTRIAANAVPIHQRRAAERPRLIHPTTPHNTPSTRNQVSLKSKS